MPLNIHTPTYLMPWLESGGTRVLVVGGNRGTVFLCTCIFFHTTVGCSTQILAAMFRLQLYWQTIQVL